MRREAAGRVVTGASSGIGAATSAPCGRRLRRGGGARRVERCEELLERSAARPCSSTLRSRLVAGCEGPAELSVLVNNAGWRARARAGGGGERGVLAPDVETNVLGVMRVTKDAPPALEASGNGHIVVIGSVAASRSTRAGRLHRSEHAANAVTRTLRLELLGKPLRVSEVAPGMVTLISRWSGSRGPGKGGQGLRGHDPLTARRRRRGRLRRHPAAARGRRLPIDQADAPSDRARRPPRLTPFRGLIRLARLAQQGARCLLEDAPPGRRSPLLLLDVSITRWTRRAEISIPWRAATSL